MNSLPKSTLNLLRYFQDNRLHPILYGSQGVSLYLGAFKEFGDVDFLVTENLVGAEWGRLVKLMNDAGFSLKDEREHEFQDGSGLSVAFASETILLRDGVVDGLEELVVRMVDGVAIKTLSPTAFKKAYEFSAKDGYRKDERGKDDRRIILLLEDYLSTCSGDYPVVGRSDEIDLDNYLIEVRGRQVIDYEALKQREPNLYQRIIEHEKEIDRMSE